MFRKLKLTIEPVPECNWGISLAQLLPRPIWNDIRHEVYSRFDYTCGVCKTTSRRLHCHERWNYDDRARIQKLAGFQCLCEDCHDIKHWGRSQSVYDSARLLFLTEHFCKVNSCTAASFSLYQAEIRSMMRKRGKYRYKIDFGSLSPDIIVKVWKKRRKEHGETD